jgi:hypothetical protein
VVNVFTRLFSGEDFRGRFIPEIPCVSSPLRLMEFIAKSSLFSSLLKGKWLIGILIFLHGREERGRCGESSLPQYPREEALPPSFRRGELPWYGLLTTK